jgi:hypothetical protein
MTQLFATGPSMSTSSPTAGADLRAFFEQYARLSMDDDPGALAALYAPTFLAGGPAGSQSFANDSRFLAWLADVRNFNRSHGMRSMEPLAVDAQVLSPRHVLATVTWGATFEKTQDQVISFRIAYLLEGEGKAWRVLAYISEADQEQEMKAGGLLA